MIARITRWGKWLVVLAILIGASWSGVIQLPAQESPQPAITPQPQATGLVDMRTLTSRPPAVTVTPTSTGGDAQRDTPAVPLGTLIPTPASDTMPPAAAEGYPPATPTGTAVQLNTPTAVASLSPVIPTATTASPATAIPSAPFQPANGRPRIVTLDPGHGGSEVGAGIAGLAEKDVNLTIALKLRALLEKEGFQVVLTRDSDRRVYIPPDGRLPAGYNATRADLQERIDIANRAGADVFVSIHNNGAADPNQSGTEVWYDGKRPFAVYNQALAEMVQAALVAAIREAGHPVVDRGIKEDSQFRVFQGRTYPIFVLGPPRSGATDSRATQMPAILGETLFLSNPVEAGLLKQDQMLAAIAAGYRDGLLRYFQLIDTGKLTLPPGGWPPESPNYYAPTTPTPGRSP